MKHLQLILGILLTLNVQAQVVGVYYAEKESHVKYIKYETLELKADSIFRLVSSRLSLEFELPQEYTKIIIGRFNRLDDLITLLPDSTVSQVIYFSPTKDIPKDTNIRIRNASSMPSDTSVSILRNVEWPISFRLYKTSKSSFLCDENSDKCFMKFIKAEASKDLHFYLSPNPGYFDSIKVLHKRRLVGLKKR